MWDKGKNRAREERGEREEKEGEEKRRWRRRGREGRETGEMGERSHKRILLQSTSYLKYRPVSSLDLCPSFL